MKDESEEYIVFGILILFAATSLAQFSPSPIALGSTDEEVAAVYGNPVGYLSNGHPVPTPADSAETGYTVYRFKTAGNEFELRMTYSVDNSVSRLHPLRRLQTVTMIADKPIAASEGLRLLPGAAHFCRDTCTVERVFPGRELLLNERGDRQWTEWNIQVYMNSDDGKPISGRMKDLSSDATAFVLTPYHYTAFPITKGIKGGWK